MTEKEAQRQLKNISAAHRRAAVGDLRARGIKWMGGEELTTWNARLKAVRLFLKQAADAKLSPKEFALQQAEVRGDPPPTSSGNCSVQ